MSMFLFPLPWSQIDDVYCPFIFILCYQPAIVYFVRACGEKCWYAAVLFREIPTGPTPIELRTRSLGHGLTDVAGLLSLQSAKYR